MESPYLNIGAVIFAQSRYPEQGPARTKKNRAGMARRGKRNQQRRSEEVVASKQCRAIDARRL